MRIKRSEPGLIVSSAAHVALLAATLVAFSSTAKFDDAQEAVPVEMITDQAFNQIAKGERAPAHKPVQRAEKLAETPEPKPTPPLAEARKDTPLPPPPAPRAPDPGEAEEKPPEPVRQAALPPPRPSEPEKPAPEPPQRPKIEQAKPEQAKPEQTKPEQTRPEPAKAEPKPAPPEKQAKAEPEDEKAEPAEPPKPVARPRDVTKEPKEPPKEAHKPAEKTPPKPAARPVEKAHEQPDRPRLKPDEVAALLARSKPDAKPETKPVMRPKSGEESDQKTKFDVNAISRMLDKDKPQATASTGREVVRTASLGAPNATAQKMSPNMMAALDSLMMEQYKSCWRYFGAATGHKYVPAVRVRFRPDGALAGEPALINPTSDPALTSLAESAMRAVRQCNPLRIPAQFAPYYDQWKSRAIAFDPQEMT